MKEGDKTCIFYGLGYTPFANTGAERQCLVPEEGRPACCRAAAEKILAVGDFEAGVIVFHRGRNGSSSLGEVVTQAKIDSFLDDF